MKTKRLLRMIAILLSLCMCAAMHPDMVSAEESNQETYDPGILYNTYDFGALDTDKVNVESIPEAPSFTVSSATRNAALVGVENLGHDHYYSLLEIRTNLTNCGFSNANLYSGTFSTQQIDSYLNNNNNKVFVSRSHGGIIMNEIFSDEQDGTYLVLNDNSSAQVKYCSNGSMSTLDLHNLDLAMFVGCYTGYGGIIEENLMTQAGFQGARTTLGFTGSINCNEANLWLERLFDYLDDGITLHNACERLHVNGNWQYTTMASYVIYGNSYITLTTG